MSKETELQLADAQQPAPDAIHSVAIVLNEAIKKGVTPENMGVIERMVALMERQQEKKAERDFAAAFVKLQAEMPRIEASKPVPDKSGNLKYRFAPFEEIMASVRPVLQANGFTVAFSMSFSEGRIIEECTLQHVGGHSRKNSFAVRIGHGPPGSSESQADGAAATYAKRFALCNALNIVIESDSDGRTDPQNDARNEGELISRDKIQYLREAIAETGSSEAGLLKVAGVATFEEIREGIYPVLVRLVNLRRK